MAMSDEQVRPTPEPTPKRLVGPPTDPEARKKWAEEFLADIMAEEPGGIGIPWSGRKRYQY